jgi:cytochrome b
MREPTNVPQVRVWDPFVRVFHWLLAGAVLIAWFSDEPLWVHTSLGYGAAVLVVLRVIWGFVGSEQARFVSFVRGPRQVFEYLARMIRFHHRGTSGTAQQAAR